MDSQAMSHALSKIDLDGNPWTEEEAELFEMLNPYHWNIIAPKFFPNHSRRALHERWVAREQLRAPPSMDEEKEYCSLGYTGSPYYNPYGLADPANLIRAQPIIHKKAKARPYKSRSPSMSPINGPNYPRPAEAKILKKTGKVIQPKSSKGCKACKVTKNKCGEEKPICKRCIRAKVPCQWLAPDEKLVTKYMTYKELREEAEDATLAKENEENEEQEEQEEQEGGEKLY